MVYHRPEPHVEAMSEPTSLPYLFTNLSILLKNASKSHTFGDLSSLSPFPSLPLSAPPFPPCVYSCSHIHSQACRVFTPSLSDAVL